MEFYLGPQLFHLQFPRLVSLSPLFIDFDYFDAADLKALSFTPLYRERIGRTTEPSLCFSLC